MFQMIEGKPLPLGISRTSEGVQFAITVPGAKECRLHLYRKGFPKSEMTFVMVDNGRYKVGDVFCCTLTGEDVAGKLTKEYEYAYEIDEKVVLDPYAKEIRGRSQWGKSPDGEYSPDHRCGIALTPYQWGNEKKPSLSFSDTILYQLHVRGYTKHRSSRVKHKGTFLGITEKIPYLKEMGINAILLLPCYEFNEVMEWTGPFSAIHNKDTQGEGTEKAGMGKKINFWGYTDDAFYFAPKASYASDSKRPSLEFKNMVKSLHENGIEVMMEIKFPSAVNSGFILDCLRHWVLDYHVDGFLVNQDVVPEYLIRTDPVLADTKLLAERWGKDGEGCLDARFTKQSVTRKRLAEYNNGFLTDARRYVKGDEGQVNAFAARMKSNSKEVGVINYITQVNGFTLMDMVSYDVKHNEANGEDGRDGTELNYSWNCGIEGKSRKKTIREKRLRQMKNAMMMMMFSQGTPMILAGDEFCNSQNGNNNAYCQDNEIGWVNWDTTSLGKEFFPFVKELIAFRKEHPIFHMESGLTGMDTFSCGFPDISFHSTKAWYTDFSNYSRVLGVMLCGRYALRVQSDGLKREKRKIGGSKPDDFHYVIFNMHWEEHAFDLPKLPDGLEWRVRMSSGGIKESEQGRTIRVESRTVVLLMSANRTDV